MPTHVNMLYPLTHRLSFIFNVAAEKLMLPEQLEVDKADRSLAAGTEDKQMESCVSQLPMRSTYTSKGLHHRILVQGYGSSRTITHP